MSTRIDYIKSIITTAIALSLTTLLTGCFPFPTVQEFTPSSTEVSVEVVETDIKAEDINNLKLNGAAGQLIIQYSDADTLSMEVQEDTDYNYSVEDNTFVLNMISGVIRIILPERISLADINIISNSSSVVFMSKVTADNMHIQTNYGEVKCKGKVNSNVDINAEYSNISIVLDATEDFNIDAYTGYGTIIVGTDRYTGDSLGHKNHTKASYKNNNYNGKPVKLHCTHGDISIAFN